MFNSMMHILFSDSVFLVDCNWWHHYIEKLSYITQEEDNEIDDDHRGMNEKRIEYVDDMKIT